MRRAGLLNKIHNPTYFPYFEYMDRDDCDYTMGDVAPSHALAFGWLSIIVGKSLWSVSIIVSRDEKGPLRNNE